MKRSTLSVGHIGSSKRMTHWPAASAPSFAAAVCRSRSRPLSEPRTKANGSQVALVVGLTRRGCSIVPGEAAERTRKQETGWSWREALVRHPAYPHFSVTSWRMGLVVSQNQHLVTSVGSQDSESNKPDLRLPPEMY